MNKPAKRLPRGKPDKDFPGLEWFNTGLVELRWERGLPRLVIHEKYERRMKWVLRLLAAGGLLSAFLTMDKLPAFFLSLGLWVVEQFFERAVFRYTTIVVTPVPDFRLKHEHIAGVAFAWPQDWSADKPDMAGLCFTDKEIAQKAFEFLRELNCGEKLDKEDNISVSFVLSKQDGEDGYFLCIFPNLERRGVQERFEHHRRANLETRPGKEQQELVVSWCFAKRFGGGKALRQFLARQRPGRPFALQAFIGEATKFEILWDIEPIGKWHFRVVDEAELTKEDREYWMVFR